MTRPHQGVDIARKLRTIEWLKSELLEGVSLFFKTLISGNGQAISKAWAAIIITCYFLSRRLGLSFEQVDQEITDQLRNHLAANHQLESWYGDISACLHYVEGKPHR